MDPSHAAKIQRTLKWWHTYHGIVPGARNRNVFKLAAGFNRSGIPFAMALDECLRFVDLSGPDPFTAEEITRAVSSAYRRTDHAVKQGKPRTEPVARATTGRKVLSELEARALEDALVERLHKSAQAPTVPRSIPAPLPPPVNQVQAFIHRHRLERVVEVLEMDLDRARMVPQPPRGARDNTGEIERRKG